MGFWKNDVPDIVSLKKDEQGFITIEHSQGVFKMHESDVKEISLVKDARSKPQHDSDITELIAVLALIFFSGMQNILGQISYIQFKGESKIDFFGAGFFSVINNPFLKYGIWVVFILAHYALWFFGFKIIKHCFYFLFNQKNDILLIRNVTTRFDFRFKDKIKIQEIWQHILEYNDSKLSRRHLGLGLYLLALLFGLVFIKKIPFWFVDVSDYVSNFFGLQNFEAYVVYRKADIGLFQLFLDGMISFMVGCLYFSSCFIVAGVPILLFILISEGLSKVARKLLKNMYSLELEMKLTFIALSTLLSGLFYMVLISRFQQISFWGILILLIVLFIFFIIITASIFLLVRYFIRRRKNKNHEE
jgi:hypothetical protein